MRRLILLSAIVVSMLVPPAAFAWNDTGHMIVALIAYRRMSDSEKAKAAEILKAHPHYAKFLTADKPDNVSADEWAFIRAATWPDWVRSARPGSGDTFKDATITHFSQPSWHYVDIPFVPENDRSHINPTTLPSKQEPNILTALDEQTKKLRAGNTSPEDRAIALSWVEHLTGDVHQPLHAVSMFNAQHPNGDKGGNDLTVYTGEEVMNLHSYWDELLGTANTYDAIDFIATSIANNPECDPAKLKQYEMDKTFASWADESYHYAIALTYLNGRLRSTPSQDYYSHKVPADQVPSLPPAYAANAHELARQRVSLAGARLADELKEAFKE